MPARLAAAVALALGLAWTGCGNDAEDRYAAALTPILERTGAGMVTLGAAPVGNGPRTLESQRRGKRRLAEAAAELERITPPDRLRSAHADLVASASGLAKGLLNCRIRSTPEYGRVVADEVLPLGEELEQTAALLQTDGGTERVGQIVASTAGRLDRANGATSEGCGKAIRSLYAEGVESTLEPLGRQLSRLSDQLGRAEAPAEFADALEAIQAEIAAGIADLDDLVVPRRVGELHGRLVAEFGRFSASFGTALDAVAVGDALAFERGRSELVRAAERLFRELARIDARMRDQGVPFRSPPLPAPPQNLT